MTSGTEAAEFGEGIKKGLDVPENRKQVFRE